MAVLAAPLPAALERQIGGAFVSTAQPGEKV